MECSLQVKYDYALSRPREARILPMLSFKRLANIRRPVSDFRDAVFKFVLDLRICYTMSVTVMTVIIAIISIFVAQLYCAFLLELVI